MAITLNGSTGIDTPAIETDSLVIPTQVINGITVGKGGGSVATNTAVGASALAANTTGSQNIAVGANCLDANLGGSYNIAVGGDALGANTTGNGNAAFGQSALGSNTTGSENTAIGSAYDTYAPLRDNTTGAKNIAVGSGALKSNTTASNNTAVGYQAGYANTTGDRNTSLGAFSNGAITTGIRNTAIGTYCYNNSTTGSYTTAIGHAAGNGATGSYNTFIGESSGSIMESGAKNTILGRFSGNQGGLDIRTASNYIVLSDGDGNPRARWDNNGTGFTTANANTEIAFQVQNTSASSPYGMRVYLSGAAPNNTSQYMFQAVDSSTTCFTIWTNGTTSGRSDERLKKNIADASPKLDDICKLQVRNYEWKESDGGSKEIGLIAQEVEQVFPSLVVTNNLEKDGNDYKQVKYSVLVPILVKAIQELKATIDLQSTEIASLKQQINNGV